ncbi:putative tRNA threonylcarbamoyladenosine biosynthesis protein kae1 [Fusarium falciforme]
MAFSRKSSYIALGCEGSANKLGIGVILHTATETKILSNLRDTFVSPPRHRLPP